MLSFRGSTSTAAKKNDDLVTAKDATAPASASSTPSVSLLAEEEDLSPKAKAVWYSVFVILILFNVVLMFRRDQVAALTKSTLDMFLQDKEIKQQKLEVELKEVNKVLEETNESFAERLSKAHDIIYNGGSYIHEDHHEDEIGKLSNEKQDLQKSHEALQEEIKARDKTIAELEAEIKKTHDSLEKLKNAVEGLYGSPNREFCDSCMGQFGNLRTSCGARLGYIVGRYRTPEQEAKNSLMDVSPSCIKK